MANNSEESYATRVDLICLNLQNPERMIRQKALKSLQVLVNSDEINIDNSFALFDMVYLHVLKCYTDKYEMCRSLSCSIISEFLPKLPENDFFLGYIIPCITKRIGNRETVEESEEMRLQLLEQLQLVVTKYGGTCKETDNDCLLPHYNNMIDILLRTLRDPYPVVQRESCAFIKLLSEATPSFHFRAEALVEPIISILKHRHSTNRIAAIEALGVVSLHILTNGDCVVKIITAISPLLMDSMPYVRRECGRVGCNMLLKLRDRYSYFERIIPLVLCCLTDETEEIKTKIKNLWEECGILYYNENETELSKVALVDDIIIDYPDKYERPSLGCRGIVQRSLRVLNLILREMEDWKEDVRLHSTKLLKQVVLHSEKVLVSKFIEINPVLAKTCNDPEKDVANEATKVAALIGTLLDYDSWVNYSIENFEKLPNLGHLKCFTTLYKYSNNDKLKDLEKISKVLVDRSISHNLKVEYQNALLNLCDIILEDYIGTRNIQGENMNATEEYLYTVIVKVIAFSFNEKEIRLFGMSLLDKFIKIQGNSTLNYLHSKYLKNLIESIDGLDATNSDTCEPILLLHGIICLCGFQSEYLESLQNTIKIALENASPEGKIKIFTALATAMLNWDQTMSVHFNAETVPSTNSTDVENKVALLNDFVGNLLTPYLVWHAGRSAESVRTMATACLCAMSQGVLNVVVVQAILANLSTYLTALCEDNNVATRAYALRTLLKSGPLDYEKLKPLSFAVLTRLDDPCAEVREWAAQGLGVLRHDDCENTKSLWDGVLKQLLSTMFLHLENPEIKLKTFILKSLKSLCLRHKQLFETAYNDLPQGFPYKDEVQNIITSV